MNNKIGLLVLLSLFFFSSCKRHRLAKNTGTIEKSRLLLDAGTDSTSEVLTALPEEWLSEPGFSYLSTRSRLTITGKLQNVDNAGVNIRMKKDSLIWLSVTALGFEIARALITTEGIRIQDKFHKVYSEYDYPALAVKLGFPLDFKLMQTALLGNLPLSPGAGIRVRDADSTVHLGYARDSLLMSAQIDTTRKTLERFEAQDSKTDNYLKINYRDFQPFEEALIPYLVELTLLVHPKLAPDRTDTSFITLVHTKVENSDVPLSFPFTIPNNYKRAH